MYGMQIERKSEGDTNAIEAEGGAGEGSNVRDLVNVHETTDVTGCMYMFTSSLVTPN